MSDNIQTNTTGRLTPCLQKKIGKTTYLVEVHFSATALEIYVNGSLNVFNHRSNIDMNNHRVLCFQLKSLGKALKKIGLALPVCGFLFFPAFPLAVTFFRVAVTPEKALALCEVGFFGLAAVPAV